MVSKLILWLHFIFYSISLCWHIVSCSHINLCFLLLVSKVRRLHLSFSKISSLSVCFSLAFMNPATWDVHLAITLHATTSWHQTSWYECFPKFLIFMIIMKGPLHQTCVNSNPPPLLPSLLSLKVLLVLSVCFKN